MYTLKIMKDKIVQPGRPNVAPVPGTFGIVSDAPSNASEWVFSHSLAEDRLAAVIQLTIEPAANKQDPERGLLADGLISQKMFNKVVQLRAQRRSE